MDALKGMIYLIARNGELSSWEELLIFRSLYSKDDEGEIQLSVRRLLNKNYETYKRGEGALSLII